MQKRRLPVFNSRPFKVKASYAACHFSSLDRQRESQRRPLPCPAHGLRERQRAAASPGRSEPGSREEDGQIPTGCRGSQTARRCLQSPDKGDAAQ